MRQKEKTAAELKEFGEVMALACFVFAGIGIWKRSHVGGVAATLLVLGILFLAFGLAAPERLRWLEKKWMLFAEKLSIVMTWIVMTLTFFVVITPLGVLMRLLGKDILGLRIDPSRPTYWEPVDPQGPGSRFYLPY